MLILVYLLQLSVRSYHGSLNHPLLHMCSAPFLQGESTSAVLQIASAQNSSGCNGVSPCSAFPPLIFSWLPYVKNNVLLGGLGTANRQADSFKVQDSCSFYAISAHHVGLKKKKSA